MWVTGEYRDAGSCCARPGRPDPKGPLMSHTTRRIGAALGAIALTGTLVASSPSTAVPTTADPAQATTGTGAQRHLVLAVEGADDASVRAAIEAAGGEVAQTNEAIALYTVNGPVDLAARLAGSTVIEGTMADKVIGYTPGSDLADKVRRADEVEKVRSQRPAHPASDRAHERATGEGHGKGKGKGKPQPGPVPAGDSLSDRQWNIDMIDAPEAHRTATGKGARVGVMDTGVDGDHPDLAANFNAALSRNFTTDIPEIDGPCEEADCKDANDVDEGGHGTHVASTIASARNGHGIVGVAPDADLVNLRVGQDSGYFFLEPTLEALTYAPSAGVDVVNMSYYIDPWAFNCPNNPADSPEEQAEQRFTIEATNRALGYARSHGVTLVSSLGNSALDLGKVTTDDSSPNYPEGEVREREIDNSCLDLPVEGDGSMGVSAVGPSGLKSYYSNYGVAEIHVAAPGGAYRDFEDGSMTATPENLILAAAPKGVLEESGDLDENGMPTSDFVVREELAGGEVAYYQYMQGTSMASPHVTGVAALVIEEKGQPDNRLGGRKMQPKRVEGAITTSAHERDCDAEVFSYPGLSDRYTATCEGDADFNGFYGHGIINAASAVSKTPHKH